jgi:predicted nuclease of restriction endonuclease-like RecB superfamily
MSQQLSFFSAEPSQNLDDKINALQMKIQNIRNGLFKRYEEQKRAIEFLEAEVEDLVKTSLGIDNG